MSDRDSVRAEGGAMDEAGFRALVGRSGHRPSEAELADLRERFEAAMRIIRPLGDMDLGDGDPAVAFSPEAEPNRHRS